MSKFDFEYMANDDDDCVVFNKAKWTKEKALEQAKFELDTDNELEIITSYVQYGYWRSPDGEVYNNWYCPDIIEPIIAELRTQVPVWLVRVKEMLK